MTRSARGRRAAVALSMIGTALAALGAPLAPAGASTSPSAYVAVAIDGISCQPGRCVAVGDAQRANGSSVPRAWTLSHGQWTVAAMATGGKPWVRTSSISCPQVGTCLAVGRAELGATGFAERLDAGVWTPTPLPAGTPWLTSVSCVSSTWCMAVGTMSQAPYAGVAVEWNGSTWSTVATASVAYVERLSAVSCTSVSFCMVVGSAQSTPFAETWNGSAWTVALAPTTAYPESFDLLNGISCTSTSFCLSTGDVGGCCGTFNATSLRWDGSSWTSVLTPLTQVSLGGISCATATSCLAVGTHGPADVPKFPPNAVVEQWNGAAWSALAGAGFGHQSELDSVSCTRASWCAAVGSVTFHAGAVSCSTNVGCAQPLVERWDGVTLNRMWAAS
jgi:hypothetical protein